jgi:hypothetical protein
MYLVERLVNSRTLAQLSALHHGFMNTTCLAHDAYFLLDLYRHVGKTNPRREFTLRVTPPDGTLASSGFGDGVRGNEKDFAYIL